MAVNDSMSGESSSESDRDALIDSLAERLATSTVGSGSSEMITQVLQSYPSALLVRLDACEYEGTNAYELLCKSIAHGASPEVVSDQLVLFGTFHDTSVFFASHRVSSLRHYEMLSLADDLSTESDEVIAKCVALIMVTAACADAGISEVFRKGEPIFVLNNLGLVKLVLAHPDKAVHIADFIMDRRKIDLPLLRELVSNEVLSQGHGAL